MAAITPDSTAAGRDGTTQLAAHGYEVVVGTQGAALHAVRHAGRDLVLRTSDAVATPPFAGAVLTPWPNRVADGRYRFEGVAHQLAVNEVGRGNALHGLALWQDWAVVERSPAAVAMEHTIRPQPGYPFTVTTRATYELTGEGLQLTLRATNIGATAAPVGLSAHPYLAVGDGGRLDDWTMRLPCDEVIVTDDRLLPRSTVPVGRAGLDFRSPARIGAAEIDHAFAAVHFVDGRAEAELTGPDGGGVRITWDERCRWLQVYTLHAPGTPLHRRAVAIEPMTCAPNAFNSGDGLTVLAPGETLSAWLAIDAVTG